MSQINMTRALTSLVLFMSIGCARPSSDSGAMVDVTDDLGRVIRVKENPATLISLAPNITELIFAAQASDRLVAVSTADNYPPEVASMRQVSALPVDVETLVSIGPDLVFANAEVNRREDADRLSELGVPVFVVETSSIDGMINDVARIGKLTNREAEAASHAELLRSAVANLKRLTGEVEQRPSVLVLVGDDPMYGFGKGSYIHDLVSLAGAESVTEHLDEAAPVLSEEFVIQTQPDFIVGAFGQDYDVSAFAKKHPAFSVLDAVREGRVVTFDPDLLLRPGPRLIDGAYQLALTIRPDLFDTSGAGVTVIE